MRVSWAIRGPADLGSAGGGRNFSKLNEFVSSDKTQGGPASRNTKSSHSAVLGVFRGRGLVNHSISALKYEEGRKLVMQGLQPLSAMVVCFSSTNEAYCRVQDAFRVITTCVPQCHLAVVLFPRELV